VSDERKMDESVQSSTVGPWIFAIAAVIASAGWLGWQWMHRPPQMQTARIYVEGKAWEKAAPMLERILDEDPENAEASRLLVNCLVNLNRYDEAVLVLLRAPGDAAEKADALYGAGVIHMLANKRRHAERDWKSVLALDESIPGVAEWQQKARSNLCTLFAVERRRRDFLDVSEEMFDHSLPKDRHAPLRFRMRSLVNVVEPNAAIKDLDPAVAADPDDLASRAAIALYLADLDKFDEALDRVQECRARTPSDLFVWETWCTILDRKGDVKGIVEALKTIPPSAEESAVAARMQSIAAEQRGDLDAAAAHLRRAMALDPDPGHHQRMGRLLMRQKKPDEAKRELELSRLQSPVLSEVKEFIQRYQEASPDDIRQFADWANDAAVLMDKLERADEARRWRLAALAADPSHRLSLAALERDAARRFGRE
jgi:tetratricopeptide (TPR) repeat protein